MCRLDTKTYRNNDGTERVVDIIYRCSEAPEEGFCEPMLDDRPRGSRSDYARSERRSPERSTSDSVLTTQGFNGRERSYRVIRSQSIRQSRRGQDHYSPSSATSAPPSFPMPRAPTPPETGVEFPSPQGRSSPRYTERRPIGAGPYRPSSSPTFVERRPARYSDASSTVAEVAPIGRQSPDTRRPKVVDTSRTPSSPALSSPGLGQLPRVGTSKHDSARESPVPDDDVKYRPRQPSSPSFRERQRREEDERQARIERERLARNPPPVSPDVDLTADFPLQRAKEVVESDEYDRLVEADRRRMAREQDESTARQRPSAEAQRTVSHFSPRTGMQTASRPRASVVLHQEPRSGSSSKNPLQRQGTNIIAREQGRMEGRDDSEVQRASRRLEDVTLADEGQSSSKQKRRSYRRDRDDDSDDGVQRYRF